MKTILPLLLLFSVRAFAASAGTEITPESVTAMMNAYRAEAGLPPLRLDAKLTRAADARMQDMIDGEWWDHESPEGASPFLSLAAVDYDYAFAAENLAAGYETVGVLVEAWMESPGHRENIMGVQYAECGIAMIEGSTKGKALGKSVVVMFGRKKVPMLAGTAGGAGRQSLGHDGGSARVSAAQVPKRP